MSAPFAASINTGTDIYQMGTSDQDSNFFHAGACIAPYAALPPSVEDIKEKAKGIKRTLYFNKNEIEIVEKRTRLLRTVPTIVIAHTFCASPDTRISYRQCLLIQGYFCAVLNYPEKVDLSKYSWYPKRKLGVTMHF